MTSMDAGFAAPMPHLGERIFALVDHELPPAEEAMAREHLSRCPKCRREHARIECAVETLRKMGRARAPATLSGRILKRLRGERRGLSLSAITDQKVQYEGGIIVVLAAAMALAVMMFAIQNTQSVTVTLAQPVPAAHP